MCSVNYMGYVLKWPITVKGLEGRLMAKYGIKQ